jgi:hypothetical protein
MSGEARTALFLTALGFGNLRIETITNPLLEQGGNILRKNLRTPTFAEHSADHPAVQTTEADMGKPEPRALGNGL